MCVPWSEVGCSCGALHRNLAAPTARAHRPGSCEMAARHARTMAMRAEMSCGRTPPAECQLAWTWRSPGLCIVTELATLVTVVSTWWSCTVKTDVQTVPVALQTQTLSCSSLQTMLQTYRRVNIALLTVSLTVGSSFAFSSTGARGGRSERGPAAGANSALAVYAVFVEFIHHRHNYYADRTKKGVSRPLYGRVTSLYVSHADAASVTGHANKPRLVPWFLFTSSTSHRPRRGLSMWRGRRRPPPPPRPSRCRC